MIEPLSDVRVIDLGRFIAAPYCGMLLADLGADVIRVERREGGEDRKIGPVTPNGDGGMYLNLNRNKRGMALDLAHPQCRPVIERLVSSADIVVANLPAAALKKLALDDDSLRQIKPDIIFVTATAFGSTGPYADRVGFDTIAQAMSGAMHLTGFPGAPVRAIAPYADYGTALHGALGAVAALYQREKTGRGQHIEVSLLATSVTFMQPYLAERAVTGRDRAQLGNTSFYVAPSDTFQTSDGWIMLSVVGDWMFRRWARLVGQPDWIDDPRFADDLARADHHAEIQRVMSGWCAARTSANAVRELSQTHIPAGRVYDLDEVLADPQVQAESLVVGVDHPGCPQPVPLTPMPIRLGAPPTPPRRLAPQLGEHTDEVLDELGFTASEIATLRAAQAIA